MSQPALVNPAYLSLGSNLGNRREFLKQALTRLQKRPGIKVLGISPVFISEPLERKNQPEFLNLMVKIETALTPENLLKVCREIEGTLGRRRTVKYGPRRIDIDIIAIGKIIVTTPELTVPHPRYRNRRFVLEPLARMEPAFRDPGTGEGINTLLAAVTDQRLRETEIILTKESCRER